jgi:uncharacterized membrane protein YdcZ (DUF606 family)
MRKNCIRSIFLRIINSKNLSNSKNMTKTIGIILVAIGILMMLYTGFNYITTKKVVDIGALQVNKEENHPVQWSPIVGGIVLVAGIIIIVSDKKRS